MKTLFILLLSILPIYAAVPVGGLRINFDTTGTNTTSARVTVTALTNLNTGAIVITNVGASKIVKTDAGSKSAAAVSGTDYAPATSGSAILTGNGSGGFSTITDSAGLAGKISDETGTGALTFANTPTLVTPVLGVASATTINKVALTAPATGSTLTIADGKTLTATETTTLNGQSSTGLPVEFCIAMSDETTVITTGTAKVTWRAPFAFTVTEVRSSLTTASSSGLPTVDINENGSTILSTKLTIDANELTSTTAATPPVISDSSIADDAQITMDIDVAGTGATGLKVWVKGYR